MIRNAADDVLEIFFAGVRQDDCIFRCQRQQLDRRCEFRHFFFSDGNFSQADIPVPDGAGGTVLQPQRHHSFFRDIPRYPEDAPAFCPLLKRRQSEESCPYSRSQQKGIPFHGDSRPGFGFIHEFISVSRFCFDIELNQTHLIHVLLIRQEIHLPAVLLRDHGIFGIRRNAGTAPFIRFPFCLYCFQGAVAHQIVPACVGHIRPQIQCGGKSEKEHGFSHL